MTLPVNYIKIKSLNVDKYLKAAHTKLNNTHTQIDFKVITVMK